MYAFEASDCVSLNSLNGSEVLDNQECSFKKLYLPAVTCYSKVPEGSGIYAFLLGRFFVLLIC